MRNMSKVITTAAMVLFGMVLSVRPSTAQVVPVGFWNPIMDEDQHERAAGPELGDYSGLPISAMQRMRADTWDASLLTLPEHQCQPHPSTYGFRGVGILRVWEERDPQTQQLVKINTLIQWQQQHREIWMDGRPHPPEYARHTWQGFSTGTFEGDTLVVKTDHLRPGWIRRNGVPRSDRAVVTEHFVRHGDGMTWVTVIKDPAYLTETMIRSRDYTYSVAGQIAPYPCESVEEVIRPKGVIPHHLPGTNTFLKEYQKNHGVLEEGAKGGAETLYPEFRQKVIAAGDLGGKAPGPLQ